MSAEWAHMALFSPNKKVRREAEAKAGLGLLSLSLFT
jgi:hypothetical protein